MTTAYKEESDVKLDINSAEEESEDESEEEENMSEAEDDIIDLDQEAESQHNEEEKEEIKMEENPAIIQNTEPEQNQQNTNQMTTKNNKTNKKTFFTPKNQNMLGKIFMNTTNVNTEDNANFNRTEGNGAGKTAITMLSEKFAKEFMNNPLTGGKISIFEYLLHDEHIHKFIAKNSGEHEKFNNFINRNKEFHVRKTMKLQEKIEKFNEEQDFTCHGNPNNKILTEKDIRNPNDFFNDNLNYVAKKDTKVSELRTKIVEDTNKNLTHVPVISETTKKLAEKKIGETQEVHTRLFKENIKHHKPHAFNPDNIKRKPKYKKKEIEGLDLTNLKKDISEIRTNVEKLYQDAKERKKNKEKPALTLKDIYDIDNIASESSKYVFLDSFVKDFERSVCDLFFVRDNYMLSLEDYISLLHKLGFVKFDLKKQKDLINKKNIQEEEKKNQEVKEIKENIDSNPQNNSNIQQSVIKAEKNTMIRGKSEKPEDRVFKKVDKEIKVINESWRYLVKKDQDKVNTNQVLVFLAGILGLYEGEKPQDSKDEDCKLKPEGNEEENANAEKDAKKISSENIENDNENSKPNIKKIQVCAKGNRSEEHKDQAKKTKKSKQFYNSLPFNCGNLHPSYKKTKKETTSEEKTKKKEEILLKKVVPELDLSIYSFSAKLMNHLKFHFRYFYDNRMNFLLKEKRKFYNNKTISQSELVFKPKLNPKTLKSAEEYRRKCKEQIKAEFGHQDNTEQVGAKSNTLKLEEIYNILRLKKENEIAKLKLQQNEQLIKQCTFQPNAHKRSKSPKTNPADVSKKLFVDADQRKIKKSNIEEEKKKKDEIPVDFPFQPIVHQVKSDIFVSNPIQNDEYVKKKVERYERARIERKLAELQKKKGVNNFKNVSNIEEMIKKEEHTPMKFGIETKTFKDTFEVRKIQEKRENNFKQSGIITKTTANKGKATYSNTYNKNDQNESNNYDGDNVNNEENTNENNTENYNSNEHNLNSNNQVNVDSEPNTNSNINTINPQLVLSIDVNISEDTSAKLEIYKNDDLDEVLEGFCSKYGLDVEKKAYLRTLIEEKLNENNST